jgi:hypothetical protein
MRKKRAGPSTAISFRKPKSRRRAPAVPNVRQSSNFIYSPLADGCIRVLQLDGLDDRDYLHCTLSNIALDKAAVYDALSYTWNNESPSVPIKCNGQQLLVTPSLHEALRSLHVAGDALLMWADAVCINQSDNDEKATQVQMMGTIYSMANKVIVWLGPSDLFLDMAMGSFVWLDERLKLFGKKAIEQTQGLDEVMGDTQELEVLGIPANDPLWQSLADLLDRPWFKRLWTMQEVCLARYCLLRCGSRFARWDDLVTLIVTIIDRDLIHFVQPAEYTPSSRTSMAILNEHEIRNIIQLGKFPTMAHVMQYARTRETSNPLDKVYAVLGLLDPELVKLIKIDYSSRSRENYLQLYIRLGHILLAGSPSLYLLSYASSKERPSLLPSWCPNFDSVQDVDLFFSAEYVAGGIVTRSDQFPHIATSLDSRQIILRGTQIDRASDICESSWRRYAGSHRQEVYRCRLAFLTECLHMSQKLFGGPSDNTLGKFDNLPEILMRTLVGNYFGGKKSYAPSKEVLEKMFHSLQKVIHRVCELCSLEDWSMTSEEIDQQRLCLEAINAVCNGRRFFTTSNGRLGVGPPRIEPGDIVCVFRGEPLPLILRPDPTSVGDEEIFKLVGEAYVHGVMDGEIFHAEDEGEAVLERLFTVA